MERRSFIQKIASATAGLSLFGSIPPNCFGEQAGGEFATVGEALGLAVGKSVPMTVTAGGKVVAEFVARITGVKAEGWKKVGDKYEAVATYSYVLETSEGKEISRDKFSIELEAE